MTQNNTDISPLYKAMTVYGCSGLFILSFLAGLFMLPADELYQYGLTLFLMLSFSGLTFFLSFSKQSPHIPTIPKSGVVFCLSLYTLLCFMSLFWSQVPFTSFLFVWYLGALPFVFLTFLETSFFEQRARAIIKILTAFFVMLSAYVVADFLGQDDLWSRIGGPMTNANSLAGLIMLAAIPAFGLFILERHIGKAALYAGLFALFAAALIVTNSRMAHIAFVASLIVLSLLVRKSDSFSWARVFLAVAGLFALYAMLDMLSGTALISRYYYEGQNVVDASPRLKIWEASWDLITDYPWLGVGIGAFYLFYPSYRLPYDGTAGYTAHSEPLHLWAELGIIGPIMFYAVLASILIRTIKALRTSHPDNIAYIKTALSFCALLGLIIHAHFSTHLHVMAISILLGFVLAYWFYATEAILQDTRKSFVWVSAFSPRFKQASLVIGIVLTMGLIGSAIASVHYARAAHQNIWTNDMQAFEHNLLRSEKLSAGLYHRPYVLAAIPLIAVLEDDMLTFSDEDITLITERAQNMIARAKQNNIMAHKAYYYDGLISKALNKRLVRPDNMPSAETIWENALEQNPMQLDVRQELFKTYFSDGRENKAYTVLEDGLKWLNGTHDPALLYARLAEFRKKQGDMQGYADMQDALAYEQKKKERAAQHHAKQTGWESIFRY